MKKFQTLPFLICWGIWLTWNQAVFLDKTPHISQLIGQVKDLFNVYKKFDKFARKRQIHLFSPLSSSPYACFDSASRENGERCGIGFMIHLFEHSSLLEKGCIGSRSNKWVELQARFHLPKVAYSHDFHELKVLVDSQFVIKCVKEDLLVQDKLLYPLVDHLNQFPFHFILVVTIISTGNLMLQIMSFLKKVSIYNQESWSLKNQNEAQ